MIVKLCDTHNLPAEGSVKAFQGRVGDGRAVLCVGRLEGRIYAVANACPHQGASLAAGRLDGRFVVCPLHDWRWDLRTGKPARVGDPALPCFEVRLYGDEAFVRLPTPSPEPS